MYTAYLLVKLQHDGSKEVPKIVDVRVFSEPKPSMLGFQYSYAELTRMDGASLDEAIAALVNNARRWPWLQWVFSMPGMVNR